MCESHFDVTLDPNNKSFGGRFETILVILDTHKHTYIYYSLGLELRVRFDSSTFQENTNFNLIDDQEYNLLTIVRYDTLAVS